jgi:hypothetical protein
MTQSPLRAGLALLAAGTALGLPGCGQAQGGPTPSSPGPGSTMATPAGSTAPGATLDPGLQAELNQIGNEITEVGNDLQSASASPEGDPSQ